MSSSYGRIIVCKECGDAVLHGRVSVGVGDVDAEAVERTPARRVVNAIRTAVLAGDVRVLVGTCWVCLSNDLVVDPTAVREKD